MFSFAALSEDAASCCVCWIPVAVCCRGCAVGAGMVSLMPVKMVFIVGLASRIACGVTLYLLAIDSRDSPRCTVCSVTVAAVCAKAVAEDRITANRMEAM